MKTDQQKKVKQICHHIAFLMEHQEILPDLKELALELNCENSEYLQGARDALGYLISFLEEKGSK